MKKSNNLDLYVLYQEGEPIAFCRTFGRHKALRRFGWLLYKILTDELSYCDESATALANRFEVSGFLQINGMLFHAFRLDPDMRREISELKQKKVKKL